MEEEFVKRNTDCVYFLASPLTCKKGFECEYRHSEIARLNPRDCWYWMAGNCLNPACGFRHPPLDGLAETASKAAVTNQMVVPVKKMNVSCYFYYNSFCNKGDSCPFVHGPPDIKPSGKLSEMATLEEKTSVAADLGPAAPVETTDVKIAPDIAKPEKSLSEKDLLKSTYIFSVVAQSASPQLSDSVSEGADVMKPNSMECREAELLSPLSTDQSTENKEHHGMEEWLESSPGFDVLVDERTEESEHVSAAYLEQLKEEYLEHNHQNMRFEYEDNVEYDPSYPDIRIPFRQQEMTGFYEQNSEDSCNPVKEFQICDRRRAVENNWQQKMDNLPAGTTSIDHSEMNLRDFIRRRRVVDVHYPTHYDYREQNHRVDDGRFHGRLASRVETRYTGSQFLQRMPLNPYPKGKRDKQRRMSRFGLPNNTSMKQFKRSKILSKISDKKIAKKQRSSAAEESSMFTGPKTLAEIKEEKKRQHK